MSLLSDSEDNLSRAEDLTMKKPDLRKLNLEDSPPPEGTFTQGLILGSAIVVIPFIPVLVWFIHRPILSESDRPPVPLEASATRRGGDE